jgi:long-subunit acyl-CoA synthetase (AMP-forming)
VSTCVFGRYEPFNVTILSIAFEKIRTSEEKGEKEVESLEEELSPDEKVIKFAHSLDKNDKTLWNITDGSPKIRVFKEHFGDEFVGFYLLKNACKFRRIYHWHCSLNKKI